MPELAAKLPPKRKIWQSEDYRMSIFDAAAVGVAYFVRRKWAKCIIEANVPSIEEG